MGCKGKRTGREGCANEDREAILSMMNCVVLFIQELFIFARGKPQRVLKKSLPDLPG
jgi:hypothetical protein